MKSILGLAAPIDLNIACIDAITAILCSYVIIKWSVGLLQDLEKYY